jgi:predicted phage terminase large subunit-like protein
MVCMAGPDSEDRFYVTDMIHVDLEANARNKQMDAFLRMFPNAGADAPTILIPQDPGAAGKEVAQKFVGRWKDRPTFIHVPSGSKELRADALSGAVNAGLIVFARAAWNRHALDQMKSFPLALHDDVVDALADAYNKLTGRLSGTIKMKSRKGKAI